MTGPPEQFTVRDTFRVTWDGVGLAAGCLIFTGMGAALVARGGTVDIVIGLLAVVMFGGGGLLAASRVLSRRPTLVLDSEGVRVVAPWPRSSVDDLWLTWDDIALIRTCSQDIHYYRGTARQWYLVFVPHSEADQPFHPPTPWEPNRAVRVRRSWDHTVDEVVAAARRYRPGLALDDRRPPGTRRQRID
ncbi:STM3941 family protein [Nocardiopsis rhodophaea]|uniref:STM3941 family protein n=1 Tax=Nocardiopsis rhodophaea TaxID=280238 RepID=UPI0031E48CB2